MKFLFLILLLTLPMISIGAEATLKVKALGVKFSGYEVGCGDDSNCIPHYVWNIYTVKVREVIEGELEYKKITLAVSEHARRKIKYFRNWKIVVDTFEDQKMIDDLGTKYYLKREVTK